MAKNKVGDTGIYVETNIDAPMDELWAKTQIPELHQSWDLRFSGIEYLTRENNSQAQQFSYSTRIGFGLNISGEGESVGSRANRNGSRISGLKFWSDDPKSLIREGSGYWMYIPSEKGILFVTRYDYSTRYGVIGRIFDGLIFRPLMGWATAWSFDRLRLWLEKKIDPALALERSVIYWITRLIIVFVWIYQGLVPKLIFQDQEEINMVVSAGIQRNNALSFVRWVGWVEIAIGLLFLLAWGARNLFLANIGLMLGALAGVAANSPQHLFTAFNPVTLNIPIMALSMIGYISGKYIPSANRCRRKKLGAES